MREAVEAQLDPARSPEEQLRLLEKVAGKIAYWQHSRKRSAKSHRKRRLRELDRCGIRLSALRKCFGRKVAL